MSLTLIVGTQKWAGDDELRGAEVATEKSASLLSVSVQPPPARNITVVLLPPEDGVVSAQFALPYPRKSTIVPPVGHAPVNAVLVFVTATFPDVALMLVVPVVSGVGRGDPTAAFDAS